MTARRNGLVNSREQYGASVIPRMSSMWALYRAPFMHTTPPASSGELPQFCSLLCRESLYLAGTTEHLINFAQMELLFGNHSPRVLFQEDRSVLDQIEKLTVQA